MPNPTGRFIALEGPDGSGKTTQAARLVAWLRDLGCEAVPCREPGGTLLGERVRSLVMERSGIPIGLRSEMLLYMASRAQLVEEVIRPALERGSVIVSDRFLLSNVVYQGYAGGLDVGEIWDVGWAATGGLMPDLTLLIDVPVDVGSARSGPPRDRIEDRPESYKQGVREGFLRAIEGARFRHAIIDGSADVESVSSRIQSEVQSALGIGPRP